MNTQEALKKLFSLHQFGIKLGLENITNLCNHIGNPQKKLNAFHIAGSNGKGSTASFMASILQEAGFKVGLFTSPHFVSFTERIRINGEMIPIEYVRDFMTEYDQYIESNSPTFFELTTAMAFKYFAEQNIDYAVIETGLGGRLDATNLINPIASVITSISLEHSNILGNTVEQIASEKAGIIKNNSKVYLSEVPQEAQNVICEIANERNSKIIKVSDNIILNEDYASLKYSDKEYHYYDLPLKGRYQFYNAGVASLTLLDCLPKLDSSSILNGLQRVVENTGIWGRYEIYSDNPKIIFDAAHNSEGVYNFLSEFKKEAGNYSKRTLIFGAMKDKNLEDILNKLSTYFDDIFITSINYERAASINEIQLILKKLNLESQPLEAPSKFIKNFNQERAGECLVVLGSIYIIGEIKRGLM